MGSFGWAPPSTSPSAVDRCSRWSRARPKPLHACPTIREGLWTSPDTAAVGKATNLVAALRKALPILESGATLEAGEHWGVLVARGTKGTLAVNMTYRARTAVVDGTSETLAADTVQTTR